MFLVALAGAGLAFVTREKPPVAPPSTVSAPTETPTATSTAPTPTTSPQPTTEAPEGPASAAELQALLDRGDFAAAERRARASSQTGLAERAALLDALSRW